MKVNVKLWDRELKTLLLNLVPATSDVARGVQSTNGSKRLHFAPTVRNGSEVGGGVLPLFAQCVQEPANVVLCTPSIYATACETEQKRNV